MDTAVGMLLIWSGSIVSLFGLVSVVRGITAHTGKDTGTGRTGGSRS